MPVTGKKRLGSALQDSSRNVSDFVTGGRQSINFGFGISQDQIQKILEARAKADKSRSDALASGTAPGTTVQTLPRNQEEATATANRLNQERFERGDKLFDTQQERADIFGATRNQDLDVALNRANASDVDSLINRGLFNSTGVETLARGRAADAARERTNIAESVARQKNDITSNRIGFIERRTDAATDPALFANLQRSATGAITSTPQVSSGTGSTQSSRAPAKPVSRDEPSSTQSRSEQARLALQARQQAARDLKGRNAAAQEAERVKQAQARQTSQGRASETTNRAAALLGKTGPQPIPDKPITAKPRMFDVVNRNTNRTFQANESTLKILRNSPEDYFIIGPSGQR
jgi:hypothetical protein